MCALDISTPQGTEVCKFSNLTPNFAELDSSTLLYVYGWKSSNFVIGAEESSRITVYLQYVSPGSLWGLSAMQHPVMQGPERMHLMCWPTWRESSHHHLKFVVTKSAGNGKTMTANALNYIKWIPSIAYFISSVNGIKPKPANTVNVTNLKTCTLSNVCMNAVSLHLSNVLRLTHSIQRNIR